MTFFSGNLGEQPECPGFGERLAIIIQIQKLIFRFCPKFMKIVPCQVASRRVWVLKKLDGLLCRSYFRFRKVVFASVWRDSEDPSLLGICCCAAAHARVVPVRNKQGAVRRHGYIHRPEPLVMNTL